MNATNPPPTNPVELIQQLDPDAIRDRLDALERERKALLVLLRAALRMEREERPRKPPLAGAPEQVALEK